MSKMLENELAKIGLSIESDTLVIPRKTTIKLEVNKIYIVRLLYNALHPATNSIVSINFNQGSVPTEEYYKVEINQIMNNLIKITGISYDPNTKMIGDKMWSGWLEKQDMEVLVKL